MRSIFTFLVLFQLIFPPSVYAKEIKTSSPLNQDVGVLTGITTVKQALYFMSHFSKSGDIDSIIRMLKKNKVDLSAPIHYDRQGSNLLVNGKPLKVSANSFEYLGHTFKIGKAVSLEKTFQEMNSVLSSEFAQNSAPASLLLFAPVLAHAETITGKAFRYATMGATIVAVIAGVVAVGASLPAVVGGGMAAAVAFEGVGTVAGGIATGAAFTALLSQLGCEYSGCVSEAEMALADIDNFACTSNSKKGNWRVRLKSGDVITSRESKDSEQKNIYVEEPNGRTYASGVKEGPVRDLLNKLENLCKPKDSTKETRQESARDVEQKINENLKKIYAQKVAQGEGQPPTQKSSPGVK